MEVSTIRKLEAGNKKSFGIFGIAIIVIVTIFIIAIIRVSAYQKEEYKLEANSFTYDEKHQAINALTDGTISKKWDGKYHLKLNNKEQYTLGKYAIVFNGITSKLKLYGTLYQVFGTGEVNELSKETEVNTNTTTFYKLDDRKYLMVGKSISNENKSFATSNYLMIIMDKSGNALFMNNEVNMKTVKPMVLKSEQLNFDVANEKLIIGKKEIDLKKIKGSTNKYEKPKNEEDNTKDNKNEITTTNDSSTTNTITNQSSNNNTNDTRVPYAKRISLRGVTQNVSSLNVEYFVTDLENEYISVFLIITDAKGNSTKIILNKDDTNYLVNDLNPNSEYKISIGYSTYDLKGDPNSLNEYMEDTIISRTNKISTSIKIERLTKNKIYFNLKIDRNYILESGIINLYINNSKVDTIPINPDEAIKESGWSSSFSYTNSGDIVIKLEDTVYNGKTVNLDVQTKIVNY